MKSYFTGRRRFWSARIEIFWTGDRFEECKNKAKQVKTFIFATLQWSAKNTIHGAIWKSKQ
jgi:hypothetical protein